MTGGYRQDSFGGIKTFTERHSNPHLVGVSSAGRCGRYSDHAFVVAVLDKERKICKYLGTHTFTAHIEKRVCNPCRDAPQITSVQQAIARRALVEVESALNAP